MLLVMRSHDTNPVDPLRLSVPELLWKKVFAVCRTSIIVMKSVTLTLENQHSMLRACSLSGQKASKAPKHNFDGGPSTPIERFGTSENNNPG